MFTYKRVSRSLALIGAGMVLALWSGPAAAFVVNCPGQSIQAALNAGENFIEVTGTCNESVFIGRDNVTIRQLAFAPPAVITGGLSVNGATRVVLQNLMIDGGNSVFIGHGAFVQCVDTTIQNTVNGVLVARQSGVMFEGCTLGPSLNDDPAVACAPLCAFDDSSLRLVNSNVTGNSDTTAAMYAIRNSSIGMRGGNTITNNGSAPAITVYFDSGLRQDNFFGLVPGAINGGTGGVAISTGAMSLVDLRDSTVNGGINAAEQAMVRLGSSLGGDPSLLVINGNVDLSFDSGLRVLDPLVTINGDVTCADRESSLSGTFQGGGEINCTGFDPSAAKGGGDEDDD